MNDDLNIRLLEEFGRYLASEERSRATIEKYKRDLNGFLVFLQSIGEPMGFGKENVLAYKEVLIGKYAVSSVNSILAAINTYLQFIGRGEMKVKPLKMQRRVFCSRDEELTLPEYLSLLGSARDQGKTRLWLILQTLCSTGIRVSELRFITIEAVRQHRATVSSKGKSRLVFIPKELCNQLLKYCKEHQLQTGCVFITRSGKLVDRSNIWREMKQLCEAAGIPPKKVFPHNLRHLFARTYYQGHKDLARLADILGHSSVETTRIYILSTGEEQEREVGCLGLLAS